MRVLGLKKYSAVKFFYHFLTAAHFSFDSFDTFFTLVKILTNSRKKNTWLSPELFKCDRSIIILFLSTDGLYLNWFINYFLNSYFLLKLLISFLLLLTRIPFKNPSYSSFQNSEVRKVNRNASSFRVYYMREITIKVFSFFCLILIQMGKMFHYINLVCNLLHLESFRVLMIVWDFFKSK